MHYWIHRNSLLTSAVFFSSFVQRLLYVVENGKTIVSLTPSMPSTRELVYTSEESIHCLALGKRGDDIVLYFQSGDGRIASILTTSNNQTEASSLTLIHSAEKKCQYMTSSRQWLVWSTTTGTVWKYDTTQTTGENSTGVPENIMALGEANQGIATSSNSNLLLYVSNGTSIRSQTLDIVLPSNPLPSSASSGIDAAWNSLGSDNTTRQIITMNTAVVFSTSSGIAFVFSPFQPAGRQYIYRQILPGMTGIRGIVTDAALSISYCALTIFFAVMLAL